MHVIYTCMCTLMLHTVTTLFMACARVIQTKAPYASAGRRYEFYRRHVCARHSPFYMHVPGSDTTLAIVRAVSV